MAFFGKSKKDYGPVNEENSVQGESLLEGEKASIRAETSQIKKLFLYGLGCLSIILLTALITVAVVTQEPNQSLFSPDNELHCGNSVEEAKSLGCTFDQLTMLWLPKECERTGNSEFIEFLQSNSSWGYWTDEDRNETITDVSLYTDVDGFWTNQREHVAHCAFQFLRVYDAAKGRRIFDYKTWSEKHAHHCVMVLLNRAMSAPGIDEDMQWARVKFGTCSQRPEL